MTRRRGTVAAGNPDTAAAAADILRDGGNAFDAVLAAMAAACVAEPVLCSLGGGGFLLARPAGARPVLYDFFAQTPRARPAEGDCDFWRKGCSRSTASLAGCRFGASSSRPSSWPARASP